MDTTLRKSENMGALAGGLEFATGGNGTQEHTGAATKALVERYLPLVQRIVGKLCKQLPTHVEYDDLYSVGVIGLIHAAGNFRPGTEKTFEGYAAMRIRGSVIDELRRMDSLPRTARAKARELKAAVEKLEQELGRVPKDTEIRTFLGLSPTEFRRLMIRIRPMSFISLDSPQPGTDETGLGNLHELISDETLEPTFEKLQKSELVEILSEKIGQLPDRQKKSLRCIITRECASRRSR